MSLSSITSEDKDPPCLAEGLFHIELTVILMILLHQ